MATLITACPSCNGPLRIPDELVGRRVRCPSCQTIFHAAAPAGPAAPEAPSEPEKPLWKNLQLELDNGDPNNPDSASVPEAPLQKRGLTGAVEIDLPETKEAASPKQAPLEREPQRPLPRARKNLDDEDYKSSRRGRYRRDLPRGDIEPHRGALILVLGIISLAALFLNACYGVGVLIGLPLGVTAWVLGSGDLRRIKNREMDEEGLGMTQAGWICGIVGTCLHSLVLLTCGGFITFFLVLSANSAPPQAPFASPPVVRPQPPVFVPPPPPVDPANDN